MTFRERLSWVLVVVLLALGLGELLGWQKGPQQPPWATQLEVLKSAPLPCEEGVVVVLPSHLQQRQKQWVLMELYWQFPQVRWSLAGNNHAHDRWILVAPGAAWQGRAVWQRDGWYLGRRAETP